MNFQIHIPSAHFIWANDLRHAFPVHGFYDLDTIEGIEKTIKRYAEVGLGFLFVGQSIDLTLWRQDFKTFYIGRKNKNKNPKPKIRAISSLYCDLWWYSIVDSDLYGRICEQHNMPKIPHQEIACEAGVYAIQDYDLKNKFEAHNHEHQLCGLYSSIAKICDPIQEKYYNPYYDLNFSAEQVVQYYVDQYKMSDMGQIVGQILSEKEHYHPNGWMGNTPDITSEYPEAKIEFDGPIYPMPLGLNSLIINLLIDKRKIIQDSFRELAFNYFKHIIN